VCLIADALAELGHEVVLVSTFSASMRPKENWCRASLGGRTMQCFDVGFLCKPPLGTAINCLRASRIADSFLENYCPDIVLMYNAYLLETLIAMRLAKNANARQVVELEDHPLARRRGWFNLKPWLDCAAWNRVKRRADGFTSVSDALAACLPQGKPWILMPGILDANLLELSRHRRRPFSGERRCIGYFGSLAKAKGSDIILAAVDQLPPPWQFVVTGSGELAASFQKASQTKPQQLSYLGSVDERRLYEVMCSCDVTLIPPELARERSVFPFKVLECLAAGTHVISAHKSILANPDLAFMVRWDGSVSNLLQKIQSAEDNYIAEEENRNHAIQYIQRFTSPNVGKELVNLFGRATN